MEPSFLDEKKMMSGQVTCIIPCHRLRNIGQLIDSVLLQGNIKQILLVDDTGKRFFKDVPDKRVKVIVSSNHGKIKSVCQALDYVDTEMVLCVDSDTILTEGCVSHMREHLVDEVVIVTAAVNTQEQRTWVQKSRQVMYDTCNRGSHLINACTF